jgi:uncharacterized membrane protein
MVLIAMFFACSLRVVAASITEVPDLFEGKIHLLQQLMPDGNSIMGVAGNEVFRWTPSGGRQSLGQLGAEGNVYATAISGDGTTVIGRRVGMNSQDAIRWAINGGPEVLPSVGSHPYNPSPSYLSDDGSIVYGTSRSEFTNPLWDLYTLGLIPIPDFPDFPSESYQETTFRWDNSGGVRTLPGWLPDTNELFDGNKSIRAVSADGNAVAGMVDRAPVIWTEATGFQQPVNLPADGGFSSVHLFSGDGSTLVGKYYPSVCRFPSSTCIPGAISSSSPYVFSWTIGGEFEPLIDLPNSYSDAYAVSGDGRTILGYVESQNDEGYNFIWREGLGLQNIGDFFAEYGLVIPFPGYHSVFEMSRDGLVFMGSTTVPTGVVNGQPTFHTTQWIVDLRQVVPEPDALGLAIAAMGVCGVGVRAQRYACRG